MRSPVAIVGMACRYPDADSPQQLLENSLAQRRSFRTIPDARLGWAYFDDSGQSPDRTYARQAAVLKGFVFDRARFRVSRDSYDVTDLSHWLALTVAGEAIEDIRFRRRADHPHHDAVRVVVGNTLTGEFSRASVMRLRWPYVRRVVAEQLRAERPSMDTAELAQVLQHLEVRYKAPFPVPNEDFLAGGLANTIGGRISNHFDFRGGCYAVDGACSSSLLAVTDACSALAAGDADMVLAGGVDLSLDPFELVGFSRSAALAANEMRVYDRDSEGFWPGEGCGFVALMRYGDAVASCERIYGVIRSWGISSDGRGGLTRPSSAGQMLAMDRCYRGAGFGIGTVGYFEAHGTGTRVGDTTELTAVIGARTQDDGPRQPAVISSIKANIGHTKAAAGLAGLLRATMCLDQTVLPPMTACRNPHPLLVDNAALLEVTDTAREWQAGAATRRAGVSASGFGGINSHVVIEEAAASSRVRRVSVSADSLGRYRGAQDAELFLFAAGRREDLAWTVDHVESFAAECSRAELVDLAVEMARRATRGALSPWKAAVVAATPDELRAKCQQLRTAVAAHDSDDAALAGDQGVFLARGAVGKIGLVFSGQGSPVRASGGVHARRFDAISELYRAAGLDRVGRHDGTDYAQPAIATASLAGLALLDAIGATAEVAMGHSLGELAALHWAGHFDAATLLAIVGARGAAMAADDQTAGAMAAVAADPDTTAAVLADWPQVHLANLNGPKQTIVSGARDQIEAMVAELRRNAIGAVVLGVAQAFHTPRMSGAALAFTDMLDRTVFHPGKRPVVSTVTGTLLPTDIDVLCHLRRQTIAPVRFQEAATHAAVGLDLLLEVGPGQVLTRLLREFAGVPVLSLDIGGDSLAPFLHAAGAAYVLGHAPSIGRIFTDRHARPFDWSWNPTFLQNPCETLRDGPDRAEVEVHDGAAAAGVDDPIAPDLGREDDLSTLERLRQIIAEHTGLPAWTIEDRSRMLSELHLNSITVGEIMIRLVASLGVALAPVDTTEYADATIHDIAKAIDELAASAGDAGDQPDTVTGIDHWVRAFALNSVAAAILAPEANLGVGRWESFGVAGVAEERVLAQLNAQRCGSGVIVWLGRDPSSGGVDTLLAAAQRCAARAHADDARMLLVVVQPGWGGSGFARSWFLEEGIDTLVVNLAVQSINHAGRLICDEIVGRRPGQDSQTGAVFNEVFIDQAGRRTQQQLGLVTPLRPEPLPIGAGDAVVVTGGGKGISAECAQQLAARTGCALLILGRSSPADSQELADNLQRLRRADMRVCYRAADVTDADGLAAAITSGVAELGLPIRGVIHGAGLNQPRRVADLSPADMRATLAAKVGGLDHLLAAIEPDDLRLLVTFGSIIARIGLRGEADYALANEWLRHRTETFATDHPSCRCRCIEWSVWSGTGMGHRLGRVDTLIRQGIAPISIDDGIHAFQQAIDTPGAVVSTVVSGRFGAPPTVAIAPPAPRPLRFIQSRPVWYPGVELVAECQLSPKTDPYLDDHVLGAERLLPAVMALEAMAQVAVELTGDSTPSFHDVEFRKAIVVGPEPEGVTVRIAGLVQPDGEVALAIRSSATGFQINHVEARCKPQEGVKPQHADAPNHGAVSTSGAPSAEAASALYRSVLFQSGRFQRVAGYWVTEARRCAGQLAPATTTEWFSQDLPSSALLLGDPGARDAALHAIQACIPHKVVIPAGVGEIRAGMLDPTQTYRMAAEERADHGEELIYDLTIWDQVGKVVEQWRSVRLRVMGEPAHFCVDTPALMAPFFERQVAAVAPAAQLRVALTPIEPDRQRRTAPVRGDHRPDGRPEPGADGRPRSVSYNGAWRLDVSAAVLTGCDLESVQARPRDIWRGLLGEGGLVLADTLAGVADEALDVSATRVWTVREAMKKAGLAVMAPLTLEPDSTGRWAVFLSGESSVFSALITARGDEPARCVAVALVAAPAGRRGRALIFRS